MCKLTDLVTSLGSELVIWTKSHQHIIHVWNQQIVKGLCNFGNEPLHYSELKKEDMHVEWLTELIYLSANLGSVTGVVIFGISK